MSSNLNSIAQNISDDLLNGKQVVNCDGLELSEFQFQQVTSMALLSGKIGSFFAISLKDCTFHPNSIEFVLNDISVKFNLEYNPDTKEFFVVTAVEMFDPSFLSKEWLIFQTDQLDSLTGVRKSVYLNIETPLEENDLLRLMIGVRNLVEMQQKSKNAYIEAYAREIADMQYRIKVLIVGALGGVGSLFVAENVQELASILTVMGVSSFLAILLKDKFID